MNETRFKVFELAMKLATVLLTLAGILWGVWTFTQSQQQQTEMLARSSLIEFERQLWTRQIETYAQIAESVGKIVARLETGADADAAIQDFLTLYWGAMVLVEDATVESEMIAFNQELLDQRGAWSTSDRVKRRALNLLEACRTSSRAAWQRIQALAEGKAA
ncbi:MAG: hypothetical protein AAGL24_06485 [Pseudomonadota bacterium]